MKPYKPDLTGPMIVRDFEIPCPHGNCEASSEVVENFFPLTEEEVVELLAFLKGASRLTDYSKVANRLEQAISGMTCPVPDVDTPAGSKALQLNELLASRSREGATPDLVTEVMRLIG